MLDTPAVRRYAGEELTIGESLGRDDVVADAMSWIAGVMNADGDVAGAAEVDRRAMARIGGPKTFGLTRAVITLYHLGRVDEALERAREAVEASADTPNPNFRVYALQHLGISLAGVGRYAEALRIFAEMRDVGKRYGVLPMTARGIAMSAGVYMSLGDYARAEAISREARDLARRVAFPPPLVSAGLDLLFVFARSREPGRADAIVDDVAAAASAASGWHGWLWRLRLNEALAELALARSDWHAAIASASECIADSQARTRPKYEALGLVTRARGRQALADVEGARADAARAVELSRALGDPAVSLSALNTLIGIDGSDQLVAEARSCIDRILANVDEAELRDRFLAAQTANLAR
jgi:tetratricopeptide (TPR) repeat protein